jgi:glycosyltransferase involved in cell wall biosynthesis
MSEPQSMGSHQLSADHHRPRVTIGLPVYNGEKYLEETLKSLLAQDFVDFEIVISDNASTDRTPAICRRYLDIDRRIRYERNPQNIGGARNYSRLPSLAIGEYFKWASADDLCAPGFLSACVQYLDNHPEVVLAYPLTILIDADGREIGPQVAGLDLPWKAPWKRMRFFAMRRRLCNPCFGVMRTSSVLQTSLIEPYVSSDIAFLAEMALAGPIREIPEVMFYRRVTDTSCGLGKLTRQEVLSWFDPSATGGVRAPMLKVFWEIEKAIARSQLGTVPRILTLIVFTGSWAKRRCRPRYFQARDRLRAALSGVLPRRAVT